MPTIISSKTRQKLRELYLGDTPLSLRFRLGILLFDMLTILFFIVSSVIQNNVWIYLANDVIALVITTDFLARLSIAPDKKLVWRKLDTWLDVIVIISLFISMFFRNLSFLRIIRTLQLLRSYHVLRDLQRFSPWFKQHHETIESSFNLFVFIFFISACVFVLEQGKNPQINNYLDALYYTVTTLTTTGFGDITMKDNAGRALSIVIMIVGVSLFLRLVQTIFRPAKVQFTCPDCGLQRHDPDAVHCKHCGRVLNIVSDGY